MKTLLTFVIIGLLGCVADAPSSTTVRSDAENLTLKASAPMYQPPAADIPQDAIILEKQVIPPTQPAYPTFEF